MNRYEKITTLSVMDLHAAYQAGELDPVAMTERFLERISKIDPKVHAFVTVSQDRALREAAASRKRYAAGQARGALDGIPYAVKDNLATAEVRTTANARLLADWVPATDCASVARLSQAGAILLGKLTMNEFGYGGFDLAPVARCPWNLSVCAGGSSAGSAAAVSARLCVFALGTDGGGSIRIPASICGATGLAGTPGRVDGAGMLGRYRFESSHVVGPLAIRARDVEAVFSVLAGAVAAPHCPHPLRLGRLRRHEEAITLHPDVTDAMRDAMALLQDTMGASVQDVELEGFEKASETNWIFLAYSAAATYGKDVLEAPADYTPDFISLIKRGISITPRDYQEAVSFQRRFSQALTEAFNKVDILVTPTMPVLLTPPGERKLWHGRHPNSDGFFTAPMNLGGIPAISVPVAISRYGTPIGLQFAGETGMDEQLVGLARAFQQQGGGTTLVEHAPEVTS